MTTVFRDIGAYRIVREIGHGGMATVFLAEDTRHARQVALKLVSIARDREGREVLDAERWGAKLQARMAEACGLVPRIYEDGDQPPYFIAMGASGETSRPDRPRAGGAAEAVRITLELGRFLDVAHGFATTIDGRVLPLVHGDLAAQRPAPMPRATSRCSTSVSRRRCRSAGVAKRFQEHAPSRPAAGFDGSGRAGRFVGAGRDSASS